MTKATRLGIATFGLRGGGEDRIVGATDSVIAKARNNALVTAIGIVSSRVESTPVQSIDLEAEDVLTTSSTSRVASTIEE